MKFNKKLFNARLSVMVGMPVNPLRLCKNMACTPERNNLFIKVTPKLYELGWTFVVDEWMPTDENGDAEVTELHVGDVIMINRNNDGLFSGYRLSPEAFQETCVCLW